MNHGIADPLNVLLVEDDWAERSAVRSFLDRHQMQVVEAGSYQSALVAIQSFRPDVAILDIVLPFNDGAPADYAHEYGVELARLLRHSFSKLGIVFLSGFIDRGPEVVQLYLEGQKHIIYLLKGSPPEALLQAVQNVASGRSGLEIATGVQIQRQTAAERAIAALSPTERPWVVNALQCLETLTETEQRVFIAIGQSATRERAGFNIGVNEKTISSHMEHIYAKLHLREAESGLNALAMLAKIYLIYTLQKNE